MGCSLCVCYTMFIYRSSTRIIDEYLDWLWNRWATTIPGGKNVFEQEDADDDDGENM